MPDKKSEHEAMNAQHRELRGLIGDLQEFLGRPRPPLGDPGYHDWAAGMAEKLTRFHDRVARHFRAEEKSGILDDLERAFPRSSHVIQTLRRDHDRILGDLRAILASTLTYGEGREPENPQLRRWTASLLEQLAEHEEEETDLFHRLQVEDIGTSG